MLVDGAALSAHPVNHWNCSTLIPTPHNDSVVPHRITTSNAVGQAVSHHCNNGLHRTPLWIQSYSQPTYIFDWFPLTPILTALQHVHAYQLILSINMIMSTALSNCPAGPSNQPKSHPQVGPS